MAQIWTRDLHNMKQEFWPVNRNALFFYLYDIKAS
jgi:hypothetical protein